MSGTIGYDELRAATVLQVAQLMAAAAITAPKSGGQLFLAGKPNFMETVIADDTATRRQLAAWMRARGKERRERIWFRDAEAAETVDAILFVGLLPGWYPPNYDCGACGYATCAEFLHHTNTLRSQSADLEFTGPVCNLRDIDLRRRTRLPLDNYTLRLLARQAGCCPLCGDHLLTADQPPQSPQQWERWWLQVTRQAIAASYLTHDGNPGPRRDDHTRLVHASCQRGHKARQRRQPALQPHRP